MRFVENHRGCFRQNPRIGRVIGLHLDGKIGKEQMMIHNDDVAFDRLAPHFRDEAAFPLAAILPQAGVRARIQLVPQHAGFGKFGQLGAVARLRSFFPRHHRAILLNLVKSAQHRLLGQVVKLLAAQIVVATLHVTNRKPSARSRQPAKQRLLQKRHILVKKLFLQILRSRGDDHALARANYGHEISQRFSGPSPRLHNQMSFFFQCQLDRLCHLQLPAPKFIPRMRPRQRSPGSEKLVKRGVLAARRGGRPCSRRRGVRT